MRTERFVKWGVCAVVVLFLVLQMGQGWAQLEQTNWADLPGKVAAKLVPLETLGIVDCPANLNEAIPSRTVMQVIMNTFYKWNEYDVEQAAGKTLFCIVMEEPVHGRLTREQAQVLLSASRLWMEYKPDPKDMEIIPASDPRWNVPPARGFWFAGDLAPGAPGNVPDGRPRKGDVFGTDDRQRVTSTTLFPYRTICYTTTTLGRGSGALITPYVVLTAGHMIYDLETDQWATAGAVAPGQRQDRAGGPVIRFPDGVREAVSLVTNEEYPGFANWNQLKYDWDFGAIFIARPFTGISTFIPVVFNVSPSRVYTTGYPREVHGENNSLGMWQSFGLIGGSAFGCFWYTFDQSGGNSGGPLYFVSSGGERIAGIATFGSSLYNGATRLQSDEQPYIQAWMRWTPPTPATNVQASDGTYTDRITVTWAPSDAPGIIGYRVFRARTYNTAAAEEIAWGVTSPYNDRTAQPGPFYYYWVRSYNNLGDSAFGLPDRGWVRTTPPPTPTNVDASDGTYPEYVYIRWDPTPRAGYYKIYRNTTNNSATAREIVTLSDNFFADVGVPTLVRHYYWVKAFNTAGVSGFSVSNSGYRRPPRPARPTGVAASDGTYTDKVRVTWNPVSGASGYIVCRSTSTTVGAMCIGLTTTSLYSDLSAVPGLYYYYWVLAWNPSGPSDLSASDRGWRKVPAPAAVYATDGLFTDRVLFLWTTVPGAQGYQVFRRAATTTTLTYLGALTAPIYSDFTAVPNAVYAYSVRAWNSQGPGPMSVSDSGWRRLGPPRPPANVQASDGTYTDRIRVTWSASQYATLYKIYRNTTNTTATAVEVAAVAPLEWSDLTVPTGVKHYYWIKASNSAGNSAFSASDGGWRRLAPPGPPTYLVASDGTYADKVVVSWKPPASATSYIVYRNTVNNSATAVQIGTTGVSLFNDVTAIPGVKYYYWATAVNSAGASGFSNSDSGYRALLPPTDLQASDGAFFDKVKVTWTASTGATSYRIYRNTINDKATAAQIGTSATTEYNDSTAVEGVSYYYWAKAVSSVGLSDFSDGDSGYRAVEPWQIEEVNWRVDYVGDMNATGTVTKPGATQVRLHFTSMSLTSMDHLVTDTGNDWSGPSTDQMSNPKVGNAIVLTLTSGPNGFGYFILDRIEFRGTSAGPATKEGALFTY
jgi:V8-like Glu-specific endopeptidase/fibronectin type 3 domain-containing protein